MNRAFSTPHLNPLLKPLTLKRTREVGIGVEYFTWPLQRLGDLHNSRFPLAHIPAEVKNTQLSTTLPLEGVGLVSNSRVLS